MLLSQLAMIVMFVNLYVLYWQVTVLMILNCPYLLHLSFHDEQLIQHQVFDVLELVVVDRLVESFQLLNHFGDQLKLVEFLLLDCLCEIQLLVSIEILELVVGIHSEIFN